MTDLKENSSWHGVSIPPRVRASLLKKWKWILTRYSKLRDNEWIRTSIRWNTTLRVDCSKNKEYYLNKIENATKIIDRLSIPTR